MKIKTVIIGALMMLAWTDANAILGMIGNRGGAAGQQAAQTAGLLVGAAWNALNPEEQARRLIEHCTVPRTDGICECVANSIVANMSHDQWRTVNNFVFETRETVTLPQFLLRNPWIIPKIVAPYTQCRRT